MNEKLIKHKPTSHEASELYKILRSSDYEEFMAEHHWEETRVVQKPSIRRRQNG
jgi:hypothetical protein